MQNNLRLIVVVMGNKTAAERASEAKRLLDWGFSGFESRPLFAEGAMVGEARLYGGAQRYVPLKAAGAVRLMVPRGSADRILARVVYRGPVMAPVEEGQEIGRLKVWRGDAVVLEVPLRAAESVETGSIPRRALDAAQELVGDLFRAGISKL